jgi:hypothetical protein
MVPGGKFMAAITPKHLLQPADLTLEVRYLPPGALSPYAGNARGHPKSQIDQIVASIRLCGFVSPILIDEDGEIIAGHGRLRAANVLGLEKVPTICLRGLSKAQKKALRLADNKIALNAGWDPDLLKIELQSIAELEVNFDFGAMGSRRPISTSPSIQRPALMTTGSHRRRRRRVRKRATSGCLATTGSGAATAGT